MVSIIQNIDRDNELINTISHLTTTTRLRLKRYGVQRRYSCFKQQLHFQTTLRYILGINKPIQNWIFDSQVTFQPFGLLLDKNLLIDQQSSA